MAQRQEGWANGHYVHLEKQVRKYGDVGDNKLAVQIAGQMRAEAPPQACHHLEPKGDRKTDNEGETEGEIKGER